MKSPLWYRKARCPSAVWCENSFNYGKKQCTIISELKHYQCWKRGGKPSVESNIQHRELTDIQKIAVTPGCLEIEPMHRLGDPLRKRFSFQAIDTPTCGNTECSENNVISCSQCTPPSKRTHQMGALAVRPAEESLNIVKNRSVFYLS